MSFLDGYASGAGIAYDIDEEEANSEQRAGLRDERRRAAIFREEYVNRQRKRDAPAAPDMRRGGLEMRQAPPAPPAPVTIPPNAPDTGVRLGVPARRRGGPDRNAPNPTNTGRSDGVPHIGYLGMGDLAAPFLADTSPPGSVVGSDAGAAAAEARNARLTPPPPITQTPFMVNEEQDVRAGIVRNQANGTPANRTAGVAPSANRTAATGGFDTRSPQTIQQIQAAIGPTGSAYRTVEEQLGLGNASSAGARSRHPQGTAIDFRLSEYPGMTLEQLRAHVEAQWTANGFPPAQIIAERGPEFGEGTAPHVHVEWGGNNASASAAPRADIEQVYAAVERGPEGLSWALQQLDEERRELEDIRASALAAGIPESITQANAAIRELNTRTVAAFGAAAAADIRYSGNTELFSEYLRNVTGRNVVYTANGDGTYDIYVDDVLQARQTRNEIEIDALNAVNEEYRQQNATRAGEMAMEEFRSGLRRREAYELEAFRHLSDEAITRMELEARERTGDRNVQFENVETSEGPQTAMIYRDPETGRRVARLVRVEEFASPSVRGNRVMREELAVGREVQLEGG